MGPNEFRERERQWERIDEILGAGGVEETLQRRRWRGGTIER
jgi:hypothetical protein